MYEALTRSHDPAILIAPDISSAITRIQEVEAKKERRRDGQIEGARVRREEKEQKRKREEEEAGEDGEPAAKRVDMKVEEREDTPMLDGEANPSTSTTAPSAAATPQPLAPSTLPSTSAVRPPNPNHHTPKVFSFKAGPQSRGHTSYLTFATLLPGVSHSFAESKIVEEDAGELLPSEDNDITRSLAMAVAEEEDDFPISQEELAAISQMGGALDGNS